MFAKGLQQKRALSACLGRLSGALLLQPLMAWAVRRSGTHPYKENPAALGCAAGLLIVYGRLCLEPRLAAVHVRVQEFILVFGQVDDAFHDSYDLDNRNGEHPDA